MFLVGPYTYLPGTMFSALQRLSLTTDLQLCYDAGDISSWPGSGQIWKDTSGNALDATNGTSSGDTSNDWTFNGTAGHQSSGEFWRSSSSIFRITLQPWMQTLHKDGAKVTIAGWARNDTSYSGFGVTTGDPNGLIGGVANPSFFCGIANGSSGTTLGAVNLDVRRADGFPALIRSGTNVVPSGWAFTALSFDESASSAIFQVNGSQETASFSYSSPATTNAVRDMIIQRSALSGTSDLSMIAIWTTSQSAAQLMALYDATRGKFGL